MDFEEFKREITSDMLNRVQSMSCGDGRTVMEQRILVRLSDGDGHGISFRVICNRLAIRDEKTVEKAVKALFDLYRRGLIARIDGRKYRGKPTILWRIADK